MRIRFALSLMLLLVGSGLCRASDLALIHARIYPSPTEPPIDNGSILLQNGHVAAVGPNDKVRIPPHTAVIDCKGMVVTAGFWNSHVHILPPGLLHARDSSAAGLNDQLDEMFNRWGFTTVFDISSVLDNTLALRRRIESHELRGPRILTVGEPVWTIEPVYVRDYLNQNHIDIPRTENAEEAIALVRDHAAKGADGIKLFTGSAQANGKVAILPLDIARAAVTEAHRHGMPVFAHPQNLEGVEVAINSGVDVLAHTVPQMPPWTPEFAGRMKTARMALIPTLTLFDFEGRKAELSDSDRDAFIARMVAELKVYSEAGGEILFGTDIGYTTHFDTALEFTLMAKAGMSFPQILATLTTNPARRFGSSDRSGRIARGMDADLVILSADPAQDITALSRVHTTIRNGSIVYSAK